MNTVFLVFYLCMVTTYMYTYTEVSKNLHFSTVSMYKESSLVWPNSFLAQGVYCLQYKRPAMLLTMVVYVMYICNVLNFLADPQLHVEYVIASYYFLLTFGVYS